MSSQILITPELARYIADISLREPPIMARLRAETQAMPQRSMQVAAEEGQLLAFLVRLTGARRILEIGTFTGYSALACALALPEGGEVVCCDVSETYTATARRYWREAGVEDRIRLHLAPAVETLDRLLAEGGGDRFDMAFIDADKTSYDAYYERCLTLVRPGGLIGIDNVLWHGAVIDPGRRRADAAAAAVRARGSFE